MQYYGGKALLLYDDECYYCTRFAFFVYRLYAYLGYRIVLIGLYTTDGYEVKKSLLYKYSSNIDGIFWFIQVEDDHIKAYGGRAALLKLVIELIKGIVCRKHVSEGSRDGATTTPAAPKYCMRYGNHEEPQCMKADGRRCSLLSRIASLLLNGEKIIIATEEHKN